jgi:hypothetical protein
LTRGRTLFAVALAGAALSSGGSYLRELANARLAEDFVRDFVAARWLTDGHRIEDLDAAAGNALAVQLGAEPVLVRGGPFHLHPPPATLPVLPLVPLGFRAAAAVWMLLSIGAGFVLVRVLLGLFRRSPALPSVRETLPPLALLLVWPPTVFNLAFGQWSLLLAALVALGWRALERGAPRSAAGAFATAVAFKSTPALLFGYLALRARPVGVMAAAGLAALTAVAWPFCGGAAAWRVFLRDGPLDVRVWESWPHNTVSIRGIFARLLVGDRFVQAPFHNPTLAGALSVGVSLGLIGAATFLTARRPRNAGDGPAFAMWAALIALLNPLSWVHNALFLLLPAVLVARDTRRRGRRVAVAAGLALLTIPFDTLWRLLGDLPFAASRAWLLGVHAAGALLIFGAAAVETARASGEIS